MPSIPIPSAGVAADAAASHVDATRCPICSTANVCAMEIERETGRPQPPCWCMNATFTESLRAQVPAALRGRACICAACAAAASAATGQASG